MRHEISQLLCRPSVAAATSSSSFSSSLAVGRSAIRSRRSVNMRRRAGELFGRIEISQYSKPHRRRPESGRGKVRAAHVRLLGCGRERIAHPLRLVPRSGTTGGFSPSASKPRRQARCHGSVWLLRSQEGSGLDDEIFRPSTSNPARLAKKLRTMEAGLRCNRHESRGSA